MNTKLSLKQIMIAASMAAGVSIAMNAIIFFVCHATGIFTDDIMIQPDQALSMVPIIISSILPTFVGAFIFFLFEKYSENGFKYFSILSVVFLLISFSGPFTSIPGVTIAYALTLNLMHIVVASSLLFFIKRAKN